MRVQLVRLDDFVGRDVASKAADTTNDQTERGDAYELKDDQETTTGIRGRIHVAETDSQDGLITSV